jgi:hypothetical protein
MILPPIRIDSILGGRSPLQYLNAKGQFDASLGIDPEFPVDDSVVRSSGLIRPTAMAKFSAAAITGVPLWFVTNPKTTNTYLYANDGKVHTITSGLAMGTALNGGSALTTASGNGADYYDNAAYFARNLDIARYTPLDGAPALTQNYWTGTLGLTALSNTAYPSVRGIAIPNHPMHRHTDNKLYVGDVLSTNQGALHYVKTTKTSVEGDTNSGSTYNALNFPYGWWPTAIESYGTSLAVALIEGTDTTIKQRHAKVAFWDTTSASYNFITDVEFPDPLITALRNVNGVLWVFSGNASAGVRVSRFVGGYSFQEVAYFEEGAPPFQGAVDHELNRICFGGYTTFPASTASVFSVGMKNASLGGTPVHNIFVSTSAGATQMVTALKFLEHANGSRLRPVIGWSDGSAKGLDSISTTYGTNYLDTEHFPIGRPFKITEVHIPLAQAVGANMTLTVKAWFDNRSSSVTLATINNSGEYSAERFIKLFPIDAIGQNEFQLEFIWSGTALLTVGLPITIYTETIADNG